MSKELSHSSEHLGLMEKSVGKLYPLCVSYRGVPGKGHWYIWNCRNGYASGTVYLSCQRAHEYAEWLLHRIRIGEVDALGLELAGSTIDDLDKDGRLLEVPA